MVRAIENKETIDRPVTLVQDDLWNLVLCCWNHTPSKRPRLAELLAVLRQDEEESEDSSIEQSKAKDDDLLYTNGEEGLKFVYANTNLSTDDDSYINM